MGNWFGIIHGIGYDGYGHIYIRLFFEYIHTKLNRNIYYICCIYTSTVQDVCIEMDCHFAALDCRLNRDESRHYSQHTHTHTKCVHVQCCGITYNVSIVRNG